VCFDWCAHTSPATHTQASRRRPALSDLRHAAGEDCDREVFQCRLPPCVMDLRVAVKAQVCAAACMNDETGETAHGVSNMRPVLSHYCVCTSDSKLVVRHRTMIDTWMRSAKPHPPVQCTPAIHAILAAFSDFGQSGQGRFGVLVHATMHLCRSLHSAAQLDCQ
jgi:hypothetical protein